MMRKTFILMQPSIAHFCGHSWDPLQIIPSWSGFNVLVHSGTLVMKSNVSYLDCIDDLATEMSTIYQVKYFDSDQDVLF